MRNKYPNRTTYNKQLGEGATCLFDPDYKFCVTVQWNGTKYLITHAWKETDIDKLRVMMDYPFIRSKNDTKKVLSIIQTNCDHKWDYYAEHAYCLVCGSYKEGDFQAETKEQDTQIIVKPTPLQSRVCAYRLRTFQEDPSLRTGFTITKNWICLLENCEFFRQRCMTKRKVKCQYSEVKKPIDLKEVSYENWLEKESS